MAPNRTARANYRGATWDVELVPGDQPVQRRVRHSRNRGQPIDRRRQIALTIS